MKVSGRSLLVDSVPGAQRGIIFFNIDLIGFFFLSVSDKLGLVIGACICVYKIKSRATTAADSTPKRVQGGEQMQRQSVLWEKLVEDRLQMQLDTEPIL